MISLERNFALDAPDPALTTLWKLQIPFGDSVNFLFAESITATFQKIPAEARFSEGSNMYYPGNADVDGISIAFYETHDHLVGSWLVEWQKMVFNNSGGVYGAPINYKKPIIANLYSKHSKKPIKVLTYEGCWPTDRGPYELNYEEETGRIKIQAQFSVDDVKEI